ncbi:hypothetical protein [Microbispora oryzae]|uniref:hypothetical protein n=1 Tax=Microbispora oryzae TaxID=2806554 RepID=UPI0027DE238C|nr:hypothetical protein [Microbispora oryzae]
MTDEVLAEGYGGYAVSGYDPDVPGRQTVTVSYTVADRTRTAAFHVEVLDQPVAGDITSTTGRCGT